MCKGISSAFLSSEMACYCQFSLSGICIISVILHTPATLHVIRAQNTPFLRISSSDQVLIYTEMFFKWKQNECLIPITCTGEEGKEIHSVPTVFHLLKGKYSWSCLSVFRISEEQVGHKPYVQSKLGSVIMKQSCPQLQHWTCS